MPGDCFSFPALPPAQGLKVSKICISGHDSWQQSGLCSLLIFVLVLGIVTSALCELRLNVSGFWSFYLKVFLTASQPWFYVDDSIISSQWENLASTSLLPSSVTDVIWHFCKVHSTDTGYQGIPFRGLHPLLSLSVMPSLSKHSDALLANLMIHPFPYRLRVGMVQFCTDSCPYRTRPLPRLTVAAPSHHALGWGGSPWIDCWA